MRHRSLVNLIILTFVVAMSPPVSLMAQNAATPPALSEVRVVAIVADDRVTETTGTSVCLSWVDETDMTQETCDTWQGSPLSVQVPVSSQVIITATPADGSGLAPSTTTAIADQDGVDVVVTMISTPVLTPTPTVAIQQPPTQVPTEEPAATGESEPDWSSMARQTEEPLFQPAQIGTATISVTLQAPDGSLVTEPARICAGIDQVVSCGEWTGEPFTAQLPEGAVIVTVTFDIGSPYADVLTNAYLRAGEITDVPITLQPRPGGQLDVYLSTSNGDVVPVGTETCAINRETEASTCLMYNGNPVPFSDLDEGDYTVIATPPVGSSFDVGTT